MKASGSYVLNDDHTIVAKVMVLPGTHCVTWTEFEAIEIDAAILIIKGLVSPCYLDCRNASQTAYATRYRVKVGRCIRGIQPIQANHLTRPLRAVAGKTKPGNSCEHRACGFFSDLVAGCTRKLIVWDQQGGRYSLSTPPHCHRPYAYG